MISFSLNSINKNWLKDATWEDFKEAHKDLDIAEIDLKDAFAHAKAIINTQDGLSIGTTSEVEKPGPANVVGDSNNKPSVELVSNTEIATTTGDSEHG